MVAETTGNAREGGWLTPATTATVKQTNGRQAPPERTKYKSDLHGT
jgi:hypothetical protein